MTNCFKEAQRGGGKKPQVSPKLSTVHASRGHKSVRAEVYITEQRR